MIQFPFYMINVRHVVQSWDMIIFSIIWLTYSFIFYTFQVDDLCKAYPNFVNYFEQAKTKIQHCDKNKQRFHAFLKVC